MTNNQPIGLIDSGVGGLSILNEVAKQLPQENLLYIGDNSRAPYGVRTVSEIKKFTLEMVNTLLEKDIKSLVIACNTITAHMLDPLQQQLDIPVIGVIEPAARRAVGKSQNKHIGVIATNATIASNSYQTTLMTLNPEVVVIPLATQSFVDIVEANKADSIEANEHVKEFLVGLNATDIDTLILGCTHFPFLKESISESFNRPVTLVDSASVIPGMLSNVIEPNESETRTIELYTTGEIALFENIATSFLDTEDFSVKHIQLED